MLCEFQRLIYPTSPQLVLPGTYTVASYIPCERVLDASGKPISQIKAVGYCLPLSDKIRYDMQGQWTKNSKFGLQFKVENYSEVIEPSREGIIGYLSSGQIKGIGPKIAERIYDVFGDEALDILDKDPKKLLSISGITEGKLEKICESYMMNRGARDVIAFLSPYGITANKAIRFYKEYGNRAIETVKDHPYKLCEISGIGFLTADKIALVGIHQLGVPLAERLRAELTAPGAPEPEFGKLDISMYRDDIGNRNPLPLIRETEIAFDVNDKIIILVDDVLSSGRTIRAALDALTDYGRPRLIRLAVLVDRGEPEYPIRADFVGFNLTLPADRKVAVGFDGGNRSAGIFEVDWK